MLDLFSNHHRIESIDQEDRALLRSNPSAWSMPEDGQEHMVKHMLLSFRSSFGLKAINLLAWGEATSKAKSTEYGRPVGHMSISTIRRAFLKPHSDREFKIFFLLVSTTMDLFVYLIAE